MPSIVGNTPIISTETENQIYLTETDRITYVYAITDNRKIVNVVNVSYDLKVNDKWVTVVRYDSEHGYLHRHDRIKNSEVEVTTIFGVIKKGDASEWLTWAVNDIIKKNQDYKTGFLKRNKDRLTSRFK